MKESKGKLRWDLMPFQALDEVTKAFAYGASKYEPFGWVNVPNARQEYFAAAMRHLSQYAQGQSIDPESGAPHLAHAAASVLIVLAHDLMGTASTRSMSPHSPPPQSGPGQPGGDPSTRPSGEPGPDRSEKSHRVSAAWTVRPAQATTYGASPSSDGPETLEGRHLID